MNMISPQDMEVALAASFVTFRDGEALAAGLVEAAQGRGVPAAVALVLAAAHIRRLEAAVRRLEAERVAGAMGGRP